MNTNELANVIAGRHDLAQAKAREIVTAVMTEIAGAIARGDEVSIPSLGKFRVKNTAARSGRNPRTGEPMEIAAGKKVSFTPAKALKAKL